MRKLVFSIFLFASLTAKAQFSEPEVRNLIANASEKELVINCSRLLQENFYHYADMITNRLLEIKPESGNYNYRKGFIMLSVEGGDHLAAMKYLNKATKSIDKNYDMYSTAEDAVPADVFFHLGRAYHLDEQFDKATENYKKFLELTDKHSELIREAKKRIMQVEVAKKQMANPLNVGIKNLGETINTKYADYSSNISIDGKALYYTSRRPWEDKSSENFRDPMLNHYPEDIYQANEQPDGTWNPPYRLGMCKPQLNEATVSVSIDERRVYTYNDKKGIGDIYYSELRDNKFGGIVPIEFKNINKEDSWETHYTVSPDGNMIFFVSDKKGGYGRRDIYYMQRVNGSWSDAKNMGGNINSWSDEDAPFMGLDNNVLYFSSNDSLSMGEFDVFMTVRDENGMWSDPVNLGYPINTVGDDIFYTHTADGKKAYVSSFRRGGLGEKDVYEITLQQSNVKNVGFLNGQIVHVKGKPIPEKSYVTLKCTNCSDNSETVITPRMRDGAFFSKLEKCKEYEMAYYYSSATKAPYKETFSTNCDMEYQEIVKKVLLDDSLEIIIPIFNYHIKGLVSDINTAKPINNAKVEIIAVSTSKTYENFTTASNGEFLPTILKGKSYGSELNYTVKVNADGYYDNKFEIKQTLGMDSMISLNYQLLEKKPEKCDTCGVQEFTLIIHYDFDKSNIRPDAADTLQKVINLMNANPKLKLELGSHTDSRGSDEYNVKLSQRRADSARKYIAARISNPKRITSKGYGETQLINNCTNDNTTCTDAEHEQNRRTTIRVIK